MATAVSVLCARVKVEEKQMIEALAAAGVAASPFPPSPTPLPVGPIPMGPFATMVAGGVEAAGSQLVIDRLADRAVAGVLVPTLRAQGGMVLDAGLAASGNRYTIASTLAAAGLPRPRTLLVTSEDAGLAAVREFGCPATMLPLDPGAAELAFLDRDIAEAVLEHREVLGGSSRALALIQAGACLGGNRTDLFVVNGRAVGASQMGAQTASPRYAIELAEATARVLGAAMLGVSIAHITDGAVVWDVQAVPAFRSMSAIGSRSIGDAVADLVRERLHAHPVAANGSVSGEVLLTAVRGEVGDGAVLSA